MRAVILAAAGKVFCSGHDLSEMVGRDINEYRHIFDVCTVMMKDPSDSATGDRRGAGHRHSGGMPVGGHLRSGHRGRGGLVRHARRQDRLVLHHAHGGLDPGHRPQARAGDAADRRDGGAASAAEWGLINRVVPAAELQAETRKLAARIAEASSLVVALGKQAFYTQIDLDQPKAYAYAKEVMCDERARRRRAGGHLCISGQTCGLLDG